MAKDAPGPTVEVSDLEREQSRLHAAWNPQGSSLTVTVATSYFEGDDPEVRLDVDQVQALASFLRARPPPIMRSAR
jgi:hypothetical protein